MKVVAILWALSLGLVGCHHAPVVLDDKLAGRSSFAFVEPPVGPPPASNGAAAQLLNQSNFHEAQLQEPAPMPVYPAKALKAKARLSTIGVHITVDVNGHVSDIRSSMLVFNTPGPFADDFRDAVEAAVRQWRFKPAQSDEYEIVHEGTATYNRMKRSEKVETEFDLSFTFTADGRVQAGK
jgi:hypothetical protein